MRRREDIPRPLDICRIHRRVIRQPQVIAGRHVKRPIAPLQAFRQRHHIPDITRHRLVLSTLQPAHIRPRPQQAPHGMPTRIQLMHEIRADETRPAGDETFH